jgi:transposase
LMEVMKSLNEQIRSQDKALEKLKEEDEEVGRLCTVPSIGPVTAAAVVSVLDDAKRFRGAHQVEAYLGLVPMERNSGGRSSGKGASPRRGMGG